MVLGVPSGKLLSATEGLLHTTEEMFFREREREKVVVQTGLCAKNESKIKLQSDV